MNIEVIAMHIDVMGVHIDFEKLDVDDESDHAGVAASDVRLMNFDVHVQNGHAGFARAT